MAELTIEQHLSRHLRFIRTSCDAFDRGDHDEAIRIAVSLRVLMYPHGGQPLFQQLGRPNLQLISTCPPVDEEDTFCFGSLSSSCIEHKDGVTRAFNEPNLDSGPYRQSMPWLDWWNQLISVVGGIKMTRGDVVRNAANKEGAHIAPRPDAGYKSMKAGYATFEVEHGDGVVHTLRLEDVHFSDLRQMAHEVLSSPDLASF